VSELLHKLEGRLWLPYQVGLEFHRRRLGVISEQHSVYRSLRTLTEHTQESAEKLLAGLRKDSVVDVDGLREAFQDGLLRIRRDLHEIESNHPLTLRQAIRNDPVLDAVSDIFAGKTGLPYTGDRQEELMQNVRQRIKAQIPPGYADADKSDGGVGDAVIWCELLDWAKEQQRPILLVTDDQKEDWYRKEGSTIVGPRPELVAEMREEAGVDFYLYNFRSFLQYARSYLLAEVSERALDEVQGVREEQERMSRARESYLREALAERATIEQELSHSYRTLGVEIEESSARRARLQEELDEVSRGRDAIEELTAALIAPSADDDSDAAQLVRQQRKQLDSARKDLEARAATLAFELGRESTKRTLRQHQSSAIQQRLAQLNRELAIIQAEMDSVQRTERTYAPGE
jgi:hypothetical protein